MTIRERVRDYLATHPGAPAREISEALGINPGTAKSCRADFVRPSRERVHLPTLMLAGEGNRQHECARYVDCLAGAAHTYPGDAHCPPRCPDFEERDHSIDVLVGASVARESRTGGIGEAEQWAGGGW